MKLPKIFCKIIGHKKRVSIGMDFGNDKGIMVKGVFCRRCNQCLEIISDPFIATQKEAQIGH